MSRILVTGADGQLGMSIRKVIADFPGMEGVFKNTEGLDITDPGQIEKVLAIGNFDYCVNCAAYTDVESAEKHPDHAFKVNAEAAGKLALTCRKYGVTLVHISTDYVFDGEKASAYTPSDTPKPINSYGSSKWEGEQLIQREWAQSFIIRTSWLYSEFGHNFVKTMVRMKSGRKMIKVVDDQVGVPTYAGDLAAFILRIISSQSEAYGTYHYCNSGRASWFDFALAIFRLLGSDTKVSPVTTVSLSLAARRPRNSLLDTSLTEAVFGIRIPSWEESLERELEVITQFVTRAV